MSRETDLMKRAADLIGDDPQFAPDFASALAGWISGAAGDWASAITLSACDSPGDVEQALKVASAYLSEHRG